MGPPKRMTQNIAVGTVTSQISEEMPTEFLSNSAGESPNDSMVYKSNKMTATLSLIGTPTYMDVKMIDQSRNAHDTSQIGQT